MSFKQFLASIAPVFLTLYLGVYLGCIVPSLIDGQIIDYSFVGLYLLILVGSTSLVFVTKLWTKEIIYFLVIGFNISLVIMSFLFSNVPIFLATALFQGLLVGILFKPLFFKQRLTLDVFAWTAFGIALGGVCVIIDGVPPANVIAYVIIITSLLFLALGKSNAQDVIIDEVKKVITSRFHYVGILILSGVVVSIELSFIFWSLILKDDSQNLFHQLAFSIAFALVFVFRKYGHSLRQKCSSIGWLFSLTILLTLSLGLFYTFSFPILFIIGFAFSLSYLYVLITSIYGFRMTLRHIAFILLVVGILNFIFGLFVQNHIAYIVSIKIPDDVLALSARQAVVKELASGGAIMVIFSGLLFMFRRKWHVINA